VFFFSTPGAVRNLARTGKKFTMLVVDEADKMLDPEEGVLLRKRRMNFGRGLNKGDQARGMGKWALCETRLCKSKTHWLDPIVKCCCSLQLFRFAFSSFVQNQCS